VLSLSSSMFGVLTESLLCLQLQVVECPSIELLVPSDSEIVHPFDECWVSNIWVFLCSSFKLDPQPLHLPSTIAI